MWNHRNKRPPSAAVSLRDHFETRLAAERDVRAREAADFHERLKTLEDADDAVRDMVRGAVGRVESNLGERLSKVERFHEKAAYWPAIVAFVGTLLGVAGAALALFGHWK